MKPKNFEERAVWYVILGTYPIYFLGLHYTVNAWLAWVLLFFLAKKWWEQSDETPLDEQVYIPWIIWLWIIAMIVMLVVTVVGLVNFNYPNTALASSFLTWTRQWSILALYPLAGCCLKIRPELVCRAVCILALQNLIFTPLSYLSYLLKLPDLIYNSPLELLEKGSVFYRVLLYVIDYDTQTFRLTLYAPWPPALGLICMVILIFAVAERDLKWKTIGIISSLTCMYLSATRTCYIALPMTMLIMFIVDNFAKVYFSFLAGFASFVFAIASDRLVHLFHDLKDKFRGTRVSSSRVRDVLARIGLRRWRESRIWGHGRPGPGNNATAQMPIGTHHTWIGLLFTKGLIGFFAFLIPVVASLFILLYRFKQNQTAKVGLSFLIAFLFFSTTETIESMAYCCWPGLLIMGAAFREGYKQPVILST